MASEHLTFYQVLLQKFSQPGLQICLAGINHNGRNIFVNEKP